MLPVVAGAAIVVGLVVRVAFVGRQSYWADELFSVWENVGSWSRSLSMGHLEIHTPFFAAVMWAWLHLTGHNTEPWTHILSAGFGIVTVILFPLLLARAGVSTTARWVVTALVATSGFAIVYSNETRPYALLLLGATAVTLLGVLIWQGRAAERLSRWLLAAWTVACLLASTTHLYGGFLVCVVAVVLMAGSIAARQARRAGTIAVLAVLSLVPQLAWIVNGKLSYPAFPHATEWITAPGLHSLGGFVTSVFSAGGLKQLHGGFYWTSPWGAVVAGLIVVLAVVLHRRRVARPVDAEPAEAGEEVGSVTDATRAVERDVAAFAGWTAAGVIALAFVSSQLPGLHTWTLRNLIVCLPAAYLALGLWCLIFAGRHRELMALVVATACCVSLIGVVTNVDRPYKTDFRAAVHALAAVKAKHPQARVVFAGWDTTGRLALELPRHVPQHVGARWLHQAQLVPRDNILSDPRAVIAPKHGIVVWYAGIDHGADNSVRAALLAENPGCHSKPTPGLVTIVC